MKWNEIVQGFMVAALLAIMGAAVGTYIEVKNLRHDVDRIEVYLDMLWKQK